VARLRRRSGLSSPAGYRVRRVAGTSAGAIVAALMAEGQSLDQLHELLTTIDYGEFMKSGGLRGKLGVVGGAAGLLLHMGLYDGGPSDRVAGRGAHQDRHHPFQRSAARRPRS